MGLFWLVPCLRMALRALALRSEALPELASMPMASPGRDPMQTGSREPARTCEGSRALALRSEALPELARIPMASPGRDPADRLAERRNRRPALVALEPESGANLSRAYLD